MKHITAKESWLQFIVSCSVIIDSLFVLNETFFYLVSASTGMRVHLYWMNSQLQNR
jgi:hypothetical protein